ncbi:MAG: glycosyl transferase [Bacteroidetes bacterium HGW-Bacteroidetes-21]|nr:MAG: glycosyl transferase [Bacteroidetes bacterium HGW-Bacteroidetes-21]
MSKFSFNNKVSLNTYRLVIIIAGALLFIPFLGRVHLFDWDEINFAESAREMLASGNYLTVQIDFSAFWEKPPLFIWFQVLSMKAFGVNEFAARFPNAICGILSLLTMFEIGRKVYSIRFGIFWMLMYLSSLLPFFYFKTGIIDPWFNLFIFTSIFFLILFFQKKKLSHLLLSAFLAGLAVMTKGPAAIIIIGITLVLFLIIKRFRIGIKWWHPFLYLLVFLFTGGFWFILQFLNGNSQLIIDFILYQIRLFTTEDAGHGGFLFYHFIIVFFGVAPASVLALPSMFKANKHDLPNQKNVHLWMLLLFWVVMILFTIVKTKIVHYSSLAYFPLTYLAARTLFLIDFKHIRFNTWKKVLMAVNFSILAILISLLPFIESFKYKIIQSGYIKDDFAVGNLMAQADWPKLIPIFCIASLIALFIILYRIKFHSDIYKIIALSGIYITFNLVVMFSIAPRIEVYSQQTAINFIEKYKGQNVYVYPVGHKSFAHLFYAEKMDREDNMPWNDEIFLTGKANKDVYIIMKNTKAKEYLEKYPDIHVLYGENGFVFGIVKQKGLQ